MDEIINSKPSGQGRVLNNTLHRPLPDSQPIQDECMVCYLVYNKTARKKIACCYCEYNACHTCWEKFILHHHSNNIMCKCMKCEKEFTLLFLRQNFTGVFIEKYHKKGYSELYNSEQLILPDIQQLVEIAIRTENFHIQLREYRRIQQQARSDILLLKKEKHKYCSNEKDKKEYSDKIRELRERIRMYSHHYIDFIAMHYTNDYNNNIGMIANTNNNIGENDDNDNDNNVNTSRKFIKNCGNNECRGFLSTQWKCGTCSMWTCSKCHMYIGDLYGKCSETESHICNSNDIESALMINNETKSCPSCGVRIFKIIGCDHMWCVQCHSAFSWNTGKITKNTSNPHYYEWLRSTKKVVPREEGDIIMHNGQHCYNTNNLIMMPLEIDRLLPPSCLSLQYLFNTVSHYKIHCGTYFPINLTSRKNIWRVLYLRQRCTEENYYKQIYNINLLEMFNAEISNVIELLVTIFNDITRQLLILINTYEEDTDENYPTYDCSTYDEKLHCLEIYNQYLEMINYVNQLYYNIHITYKKKPKILRRGEHSYSLFCPTIQNKLCPVIIDSSSYVSSLKVIAKKDILNMFN